MSEPLPEKIEKALQECEAWLGSLLGQHAGVPRLRDLRAAIREALERARREAEKP